MVGRIESHIQKTMRFHPFTVGFLIPAGILRKPWKVSPLHPVPQVFMPWTCGGTGVTNSSYHGRLGKRP
jgi:hypothetical protein